MRVNIEELLDEHNKQLLAKLRNKMSVKFEICDKPYFENYSINNNVIIYAMVR